jgi:hypothetical protein
MKRTERTPLQKAIDDTMCAAIAVGRYLRMKEPIPPALLRKFINATRRVERRR